MSTQNPLDPLLQALREAGAPPATTTRLATVAYIGPDGATITFDGESSASARSYKALQTVAAGDRVVMLRSGSTWVVAGRVQRGDLAGALFHLSPVQSIPNAVGFVDLTNWVTVYSSGVTMSSGKATVAAEGYYHLALTVMFRNENSSNGVRGAGIFIPGGQIAGYYAPPIAAQGDYASASCQTDYYLTAGTQVAFAAAQNSGGPVTAHGAPYTIASIRRIG